MISLEEARAQILNSIKPLSAEVLQLAEAYGRIVAEPILAPCDLPRFDNSAMDGYAVRSEDVRNAPVRLKIVTRIEAGETALQPIRSGECARIFTGSPLPAGADAVVMQEETRADSDDPAGVLVLSQVEPGKNVRVKGGDVGCGKELFAAGEALNAGAIGLLGALGLSEVKVGRRPRVALLATGSELREPGQALEPGSIYESNRQMLVPLLLSAGAQPIILPLVPDTVPATREALEKALAQADAVITTGGVSVGELDFVKAAFEEIGGKLEFWKVAMKPGKPFVFGRWGEKFLFGLPGNPVSAFVTYLLLVHPALRRWQGARETGLSTSRGRLVERLANKGDRRQFMRVHVAQDGEVRSAGGQDSHVLSSLANANGLLDVPPGTTLEAGSEVSVLRWEL